jgi:succinate dehydrogenase hydrophobic membrane anchor protein
MTLILMALFLVALGWHAMLGLRVVIEDYVPGHAIRLVAILALQFAIVLLGASGMTALLVIAFGR